MTKHRVGTILMQQGKWRHKHSREGTSAHKRQAQSRMQDARHDAIFDEEVATRDRSERQKAQPCIEGSRCDCYNDSRPKARYIITS